jgi:predicted glycosyltransferase
MFKNKVVYYPSYHELAYLHPEVFKPDHAVLKEAGLKEGEPYFVLRFNAFRAHHDINASGLTLDQKLQIVDELKEHGKVYITTESGIEPELDAYKHRISPEKIHSLLFYAKMFIGDSQTMTSEAAVLGVPALKCNSFAGDLSVPNELQDKYGLCYSYKPDMFPDMMARIRSLLCEPDLAEIWSEKRTRLLAEKSNPNEFFKQTIENISRQLPVS